MSCRPKQEVYGKFINVSTLENLQKSAPLDSGRKAGFTRKEQITLQAICGGKLGSTGCRESKWRIDERAQTNDTTTTNYKSFLFGFSQQDSFLLMIKKINVKQSIPAW